MPSGEFSVAVGPGKNCLVRFGILDQRQQRRCDAYMHPRLAGQIQLCAVNGDLIATGHVGEDAVDFIRSFLVNAFRAPTTPLWTGEVQQQSLAFVTNLACKRNKVSFDLRLKAGVSSGLVPIHDLCRGGYNECQTVEFVQEDSKTVEFVQEDSNWFAWWCHNI